MKNSASILVEDSGTVMCFLWRDFDGDDCFGNFSVEVKRDGTTKRFDFGVCAAYGLRRMSKFFRDENQSSVSGGFQNPDPCFYDLVRDGNLYRLSIRFGAAGAPEYFELQGESVLIDDEFLSEY